MITPRRATRATTLPRAEPVERRILLATASLDINTRYQTIEGYGTHMNADASLNDVNLRNAYVNAGFNMVRLEVGPAMYTQNRSGDLSIPIPIDADLDANIARFNFEHGGWSYLDDFVKWVKQNSMESDRFKLTGAVWSPPHWLKIATGTLINWTNWDGTPRSDYGPFFPYGVTGGNTGGGRIDPAKYQDMARWVLSFVKGYSDFVGIPMDSFSFQNEPDYEGFYNTVAYGKRAVNVNDPAQGSVTDWTIYANAFQAIVDELASNPDITTRMIGPEIMTVAPWADGNSNAVRQALVNANLMDDLDIVGAHGYEGVADSARGWDTFYNRYKNDGKPIYMTEHSGENQSWMDSSTSVGNGALGLALKIHNAFTYGHSSTFEYWSFSNSTIGSSLVQPANRANPTADYKYDSMIHFSKFIRPGAQRIAASFENGQSAIGGADRLDAQNSLNVSSYFHPADKQLTTVLVNMKPQAESTTIVIPAGLNLNALQVYRTSGSEKFVQQADVQIVNGRATLTVPAYSVVTVQGTSGIPAGWSTTDVGGPAQAGWARQARGSWTLTGGGSDIWNASDQFRFASKPVAGNTSLSARVDSVENTHYWAKAGVMIRASDAANAPFAMVVQMPNNEVAFQYRTAASANVEWTGTRVGGIASPKFVKIERVGSSFSGFYSLDGRTWTQIGTAVTISTMPATARVGLAVLSHDHANLATATFSSVTSSTLPVFEVEASALPDPVTTVSAALDALAIDNAGANNLTYTWSVLGTPPGPVTFSQNNLPTAGTIATFTRAGSYTFRVVARDADGNTASDDVVLSVVSTTNAIAILPSPAPTRFGVNDRVQYSVSATDQFGQAASVSPQWSLTGGGSIDASGTFTPPAQGGSTTLTAASVPISRNLSLTTLPVRSVREAELGSFGNGAISGTSNNGFFGTSYVDFNGNGGFLDWTNVDGGLGGTSSIDLRYALGAATARTGRLTVNGVAQNITFQPTGAWNTWGMHRVNVPLNPGKTNTIRIESTGQDLSNIDEMHVLNAAPVIAIGAAAAPSPVSGTTTTLSVTGNDDRGADGLSYTWSSTGTPPAPVTFSGNGTSAARQVVATFAKVGVYAFQVVTTDSLGASATSTVSVTVQATAMHLSISPTALTLPRGTTQQFTAAATDQFGQPMQTPPIVWSTTGGTISSAGLLTVGAVPGSHVARANVGGIAATATYTVPLWTPASVSLAAESDTGLSDRDGVTKLNNAATTSVLQFQVSDVAPGATIEILVEGVVIGTTTADGTTARVVTRGDRTLPNGAVAVHARQSWPGLASTALAVCAIVVDAVAPSVAVAPTFGRAGGHHTLTWRFSEDVSPSFSLDDLQLHRTASAPSGAPIGEVGLDDARLVYAPGSGEVELSFPTLEFGRLPMGRYELTIMANGVSDTAGNPQAEVSRAGFVELAGDANDDGRVDFDDLLALAANYGRSVQSWERGDFNYDGTVNFDDLLLLAAQYGYVLPPPSPLPGALSAVVGCPRCWRSV